MLDLRDQPVNLHLPVCVMGNVGAGRAAGFAMGSAEYVSFADHDDRILPGAVEACISALDLNDSLGAVFTGEQIVDNELKPLRAPVLSAYRHELHLSSPAHVHGLIVMRRHLVEPLLDDLALLRAIPEWWLTLSIAQSAGLERVPMLGRLWRHHHHQATRTMNKQVAVERGVIANIFARRQFGEDKCKGWGDGMGPSN